MMIMNKVTLLKSCIIFLALGLIVSSCGDDAEPERIEGCTSDSRAVNYNALANIEVDCIFERDAFLGDYMGSSTCTGLAATVLNTDTLDFVISPGVDPNDVTSVEVKLSNFDLPFQATVAGDVMTINSTFEDVPLPVPGLGEVNSNVTGTGTATVSGDVLTGVLVIEVADAASGIKFVDGDECTITGTKN